jgi:beta-lactamase class A
MPNGSRVHIRGEDQQNGFVPVTFAGIDGWAYAEYLEPVAAVQLESLGDALNGLAAEVSARSPGTEIALAVENLTTGEYQAVADDVRHVSASSPKLIWVAAALNAGADVSDIASGIFRNSDNELSGIAIDRAGGMNAVNEYYWANQMDHSCVMSWVDGRASTNVSNPVFPYNYFTAHDAVTYLTRLDQGAALGPAPTQTLQTYLTWSPRTGYGGWLGTLLPAPAQATMLHKAGWIPGEGLNTLNEIGIVQVPGGERYAVAILMRQADDYNRQISFMERASCVIYRTISKDGSLGCRD